MLGLALGVALVITITSLSRGLDQAQKTALNPLSSIGTDLTVTASPSGGDSSAFANRTVTTDLSSLGHAGQHFSLDTFSAGTQATFPQSQAKGVAKTKGVAAIASGLTLTVTHQEGKIPKITAQFNTGGQKINVNGQIHQPTAAELAAMAKCLAKQEKSSTTTTSTTTRTRTSTTRQSSQGSGSLTGQNRQGPGMFGGNGAMRKCMPASMRHFQKTIRTKKQTITKQVSTPKTDIKTSTYTIGGVDTTQSSMGIITAAQVSKGRFLAGGGLQALITGSYASSHKLGIGSKLTINETTFHVVGIVQSPLGGQAADVYTPLTQLQKLAGEKNQVNVVLVRASRGSSVGAVQKRIKKAYPTAQVASAKQVADQISGSLVSASNLSKSLSFALAAIAIAMATLLAALLTLSSIAKRVREIGTLRAIGWKRTLVVRQIVSESLAQGIVGGLLGVLIGAITTACINAWGPVLSASTTSTVASDGPYRVAHTGTQLAHTISSQIALKAPMSASIIALGACLALLGGLIAGAVGALRAARLRPADALRQVE